jgi:orotidine-5'-phosphate decarboxylase
MNASIPCFSDRLEAAVRGRGNPVLVGLDPRWDQLPNAFHSPEADGHRPAMAQAFGDFCCRVVDVVAPLVAAVKPQAAFFEQLGPHGMQALGHVIQYARAQGLLVILDAKRNDIGSTAAAYADAYLGAADSAWGADALTVSPYLGDDSLSPFVEVATERGAGVFVLVKTSNPGGKLFQDLVADQRPVYQYVARHVAQLATHGMGRAGYGAIGAVVGATYPQQLQELRHVMPQSWLLVPGFGSQGGTARDVAGAFDAHGLGAIVNNSRGIIFAHQRPEYRDRFAPGNWQAAVEAATLDMIAQLRADTPAGRLGPDE